MIKYYASHNKQLCLNLFRSSFEGQGKSNRWVVSMGDRFINLSCSDRYSNSHLNNSDYQETYITPSLP